MICTFYTKIFVLFNIIIAQVTNADQNTKTIVETNLHKIDEQEKADMLMVPNDYRSITLLRPEQTNLNLLRAHQFQPGILNSQFSGRSYVRPGPIDTHKQSAQNFYPSFVHNSPPLGHSRPYLTTPESSVINKFGIQRPESSTIGLAPTNYDSLLGSGDFGVLRGGTFYPEDEMPYHLDDHTNFDPYYGDANNGHGRPSGDEFVQAYTYPEEQFANFRDFADINTPTDTAFSQYAVVYTPKNSTKTNKNEQPKNIFEKLELIDKQKTIEEKKHSTSKIKSKFIKTKLEEKHKKLQNQKNLDNEPLLALS